MARDISAAASSNESAASQELAARKSSPIRGLLISADAALARAFRRELTRFAERTVTFDLYRSLDEARPAAGGSYDCVTVDLDGARAPSETVRLARQYWPGVRIAVLSNWWSEREDLARAQADLVIHKPLRAPELRAFLRSPMGAPGHDGGLPGADDLSAGGLHPVL